MDGADSHRRSIGIDALFQYTGSGVQLFSGMVFYIIIVRIFNTSEVGALSLFLAIIGLFNLVFSFGLASAAQHFTSYELGRGDYASVKRTIYRILSFGVGLSVAGVLTLQFLAGEISIIFLHSVQYTDLVRVLSFVLFGNIIFGILNGMILGIQQFRISAIINIFIWITYYFGAIMFAIFYRSIGTIVFGWIIGVFLGVAVESLVIFSSVNRYLGKGKPVKSSHIVFYSGPIVFSGIISYGAAYADRFIVSGLISLSSLGVYNFALLVASAIGFISAPFANILVPKFSEYFGMGEKWKIASMAEVSSTLLSYFYVPSALGIAALAPIILNFLGGVQYVKGALPLQIIMVCTAIFVTQNIISQVIASIRKTKLFIYSSGFALIANIAFSFLLIPPFGLIGAALGYSSVYAITFSTLYYFSRKEAIVSFDSLGMLKVWVSAIIMSFIVYTISVLSEEHTFLLPVYISIGIIVYIGLTKIMGIFKEENKELVLALFPISFVRFKKILSIFILH